MKLYYATGTCSLAPHIVLRELGLDFTLERADLQTRKLASGGKLDDINPKGYVPVLELDSGEKLTENAVILQYLADRKPQAGLLPAAGTMERYRALEWLSFVNSELHTKFGVFFKKDMGNDAWVFSRKKIEHYFSLIEAHLENNTHLSGEQFTVADAYLYTVLTWVKTTGIDLSRWPTLQAYMRRIAERPAVRKAMEAEGLLTAAA